MEQKKEKIVTGGRPKSLDRKSFKITGRFTEAEFTQIVEKSHYLGTTKSQFISKMALEGKIIDTYAPAQKALVLRLINISNNLNQLAKAANTVGFLQVVIEVDAILVQIRQLINLGR